MKFVKEHKVAFSIIALTIVLVATALTIWFLIRQRKYIVNNQSMNNFTEADFIAAAPVVKASYGDDIAKTVEQIFRLETGNFKSTQYQQTGTPGMEKWGPPPFYGWVKTFFSFHPTYLPVGTVNMNDAQTQQPIDFVVMPSVEAAAMFMGYYLKHNSAGSWNAGTDAIQGAKYESELAGIGTPITDNLA